MRTDEVIAQDADDSARQIKRYIRLVDIDSLGTIFVKWDCGSSLGLIPDEDIFKKI